MVITSNRRAPRGATPPTRGSGTPRHRRSRILAGLLLLLGVNVIVNAGARAEASPVPVWPMTGIVSQLTSAGHAGLDIHTGQTTGRPIYSIQDGTVSLVTKQTSGDGGWGCYIVVDHGGGWSTLYAHLLTMSPLAVGTHVAQGTQIGSSGGAPGTACAGNSGGPHLHFEIRYNGSPVRYYENGQIRLNMATTANQPMPAYPSGFPTGDLTPVPVDPFGAFDTLNQDGPGSIRVTGWTQDPDTAASTEVHVYVYAPDGTVLAGVPRLASNQRSDVGAHGFDFSIPRLGTGARTVCAHTINVGPGSNQLLECKAIDLSPNATGRLDGISTGFASVNVNGWAVDPDTSASTTVHVYVDGVGKAIAAADRDRPDIAAAFGYGAAHGFDVTINDLPSGAHSVCVYSIKVVANHGSNTLLSCTNVTVSPDPIGNLDLAANAGPGTVRVAGWTLDPDTKASTDVHVYVDGVGKANVTANKDRADIGARYPSWGSNHGFDFVIAGLTPGTHNVCAYTINAGPSGTNQLLRCAPITFSSEPTGSFDAVLLNGPGAARVAGWTVDPDTTASTPVHVYVDGIGKANVIADKPRADVGAALPGYGTAHGFDFTITGLTPGTHTVCTYSINAAGTPGGNTTLGCKQLTIPGGNPTGAFDLAEPAGAGKVRVGGWTLDPDTTASTPVHIYVDGVGKANVVASLNRPDLAAFWPGWGTNHGFDFPVGGLAAGPRSVCAYTIETAGTGGNVLLGCKTVTVT